MDKEPLSRADFRQLSGETGKKEINRNYIILRFVDFTCLPDEITSLLALEPSRTGIKGEEIVNRWVTQTNGCTNTTFGNMSGRTNRTTL